MRDHEKLQSDLARLLPTLSLRELALLVNALAVETRERALPGNRELADAHMKLTTYLRGVVEQRRAAEN